MILAVLLLGGCAGGPSADAIDPRTPLIAPGAALALPRPADLGRSVEASQLITAWRDGRAFAFEGRISVTPERFLLVGLDGMGRRAMTITWTEAGIQVETAPWLPDALRPGSMLADIVALYWPQATVRAALVPAGGDLAAGPGGRIVRIAGTDVLRVAQGWPEGGRWTGTMRYSNLAWGYEIEIQSTELGP